MQWRNCPRAISPVCGKHCGPTNPAKAHGTRRSSRFLPNGSRKRRYGARKSWHLPGLPRKDKSAHASALWNMLKLPMWLWITISRSMGGPRSREGPVNVHHNCLHEQAWLSFLYTCLTRILSSHIGSTAIASAELRGIHYFRRDG